MDVLYLADTRFPIERANGIQTIETCHALARRGHRVTLVTRPARGATRGVDPLAFYGLPAVPGLSLRTVRVAGGPRLRRLCFLVGALSRLSAGWADVVMTRDLGLASAVLRLPARMRPPLVYESHGYAPEVSAALPAMLSGAEAGSARKIRRLAARERLVWRRASGYVTITRALADELAGRFGPRQNVATVPDGVRIAGDRTFTPPGPSPIVAYAGHLYPWKGVDTLIRAIAELPDVRALVIGGHPQERDLERVRSLAAGLGVADRVTFTGLLPPAEVRTCLAEAAVLVLPNRRSRVSDFYTSPLKLFEYLAAGRPIVASDLPAVREVVEDGKTALLVTPDDPSALAAAVRRLLDDPALACSLAHAAFDAASNYSWDRRAERLEAVFEAAIEGGRTNRDG